MTDPSESVTRFKGSVPIGTTRPAGRIRQPEGSNVDPSGNEPGTRRVARSAAPAMAGSASRERLSMGRNMAARGTAGIPLALGAMPGLIFHLIPHTHWDREWYLPRAALHARLVGIMDDLIERLQAHPGYRSFLLDGQTVLVEDYLRARPDREGDVRALVKTGRLQVGPWYVLADEQIPSGEGLVRNLLLGAAGASTCCTRPMRSGIPPRGRRWRASSGSGMAWCGAGWEAKWGRSGTSTAGAGSTRRRSCCGTCPARGTRSGPRSPPTRSACLPPGPRCAARWSSARPANTSRCSSAPITTPRIRTCRGSATSSRSSTRGARSGCHD